MSCYKYTLTYLKDNETHVVTGRSILGLSKLTGLSRYSIHNKMYLNYNIPTIQSITREKLQCGYKKKDKPTYQVEINGELKKFTKLREGAPLLKISMPTLMRILNDEKRMEQNKITFA